MTSIENLKQFSYAEVKKFDSGSIALKESSRRRFRYLSVDISRVVPPRLSGQNSYIDEASRDHSG
jgi:hypothetical protein